MWSIVRSMDRSGQRKSPAVKPGWDFGSDNGPVAVGKYQREKNAMAWEPWNDTTFWLFFNLIGWPVFISIMVWMLKKVRTDP
ncbi:MAG: hypothetical protein Q7T60_17180 [Sphingopyxis sp.]|nr:hypothetical protein [Sphingopyxis sp.]